MQVISMWESILSPTLMWEVRIGDHCMIGPNTLITTVGHPLSPEKRRTHTGIAKPVVIGDDVWIGRNMTILPGVPTKIIKTI